MFTLQFLTNIFTINRITLFDERSTICDLIYIHPFLYTRFIYTCTLTSSRLFTNNSVCKFWLASTCTTNFLRHFFRVLASSPPRMCSDFFLYRCQVCNESRDARMKVDETPPSFVQFLKNFERKYKCFNNILKIRNF